MVLRDSEASAYAASFQENGRALDAGTLLVEHERIPFVSFPYEWSPAMLAAAARLTLDIAESILPDGFALKDATPYNVLFRGPQPVFVDVLSFDPHEPTECGWMAYAQFLRTFLYPLLVSKHFGATLDEIFTVHRDGLKPEQVYAKAGVLRRITPPFLGLVSLPALLNRFRPEQKSGFYARRQSTSPEQARFVLRSIFKSLRKHVERSAPRVDRKLVDDYMNRDNNYSAEDAERKDRFVRETVAECSPASVLDIGANNGHFSRIAAESGARTVAIDRSPAHVDAIWDMASTSQLDILPLHLNLARPSAAVGWNNSECASFLDRARGHFDLVLMLAVVHHLVVSERIPLERIVGLLAELTTRHVLIEFVSKDDSMFQLLTRGRDALHQNFTKSYFESCVSARFKIVRTCAYESETRCLYLLERR